MRPGKLLCQLVVEPQLGCMLLALRAVPVAACVMDAGLCATAVARREAVAVMAATAGLEGADGLVVRGGEVGRARKVLGREGVEESADGGQDWKPRRRASLRWSASSWPWCVRGRESMVVASWAWPRDRCMARRLTPASSRWVA